MGISLATNGTLTKSNWISPKKITIKHWDET
jgi:hypothetical protein